MVTVADIAWYAINCMNTAAFDTEVMYLHAWVHDTEVMYLHPCAAVTSTYTIIINERQITLDGSSAQTNQI